MSEYELTSVILELFRDMDSQIQFWLQATFAVVVAVFFAGERLTRGMRGLIAVLYIGASALSGLRWVLTLRRNLAYRERLVAEGYPDISQDLWLLVPVIGFILFIFFTGVAGTMHFIRRPVTEGNGPSRVL